MGNRVTPEVSAVNYGYVSPRLRGRPDLPFYTKTVDYSKNYIYTPQGEYSLRYGSIYVSNTKGNQVARLIPFLFNTEQAYILEFTEGFIRFYKDHGLVTQAPLNITAITKAAAAQVTIVGHGLSVSDPLYLSGIGGMTQLNGREVAVASVVDANNITININSTAFDTYTSGGTAAKIYQIASPYQEEELWEINYTQTNDTMYLVHPSYQPRKLTRGGTHVSWTLSTFDIVANPFGTTKAATNPITGITKANPAVVTDTAHGYATGDTIYIDGVVGMTEVNKKNFTIDVLTADTYALRDYDSTLNTAYTSGGTSAKYTAFSYPSLVALFDGRIIYAASDSFPTRLWFSKLLSSGNLDNFITGTLDADAIVYNVRADQANRIRWIVGAESYMALGTSGSEFRVTGGGENNAITPTNISVKPTSFNGVSTVRPIRLDSYILFPQRNGKTVRSFEYNALQDGYVSPDRTLLADHIGKSKFKEFSQTAGTPNIIWGIRNDGKMAGLTFDPSQEVVAWHLHDTQGLYTSVATIPEINEDDELWQVVKRTIDGTDYYMVEYVPNVPDIPLIEDHFTGESNKDDDTESYLTELWNTQKTLLYMDSALIYDGRDLATVDLTITGSLTAGSEVTVTASAPFFTAAMGTDMRRLQTPDGGQIEIRLFNSTTEIIGTVLYDLEAAAFDAGEWYYMAQGISGLNHLEGSTVAILSDGGVDTEQVVADGKITLGDDAGYVIVGLKYIGIGKTQDIDGGSEIGRGLTKPRAMSFLGVRLRASSGTKFGTSLYNMASFPYRETGEVAGRPPRLTDGVIKVDIPDGWDEEKHLYWLHDTPTPSNIQYLQWMMETNDE